jgi:dolichol kinase
VSGLLDGIDSEIARRGVHASGSLLPLSHVLAPEVFTWPRIQWLLVGGVVAAVVLEIARLLLGLEWWLFDRLTRSYEQDNLAGYALAVISATAVALATPPAVAVPAMLMLTLGDPISGLLGSGQSRSFGDSDRLELIVKRPRVLVITFVVCTAIALALSLPVLAAVLGGAAAMLADGVKPIVATYVIDDNFSIPIAAAAAITLGLALA